MDVVCGDVLYFDVLCAELAGEGGSVEGSAEYGGFVCVDGVGDFASVNTVVLVDRYFREKDVGKDTYSPTAASTAAFTIGVLE